MNYFFKVLKNYAVLNGRARRSEYWYFHLFYFILAFFVAIVDEIFDTKTDKGQGIMGNLLFLVMIVPSIAVGIRRMHDIGKKGWYYFIPIYNLILTCMAGSSETNEYGPNPKTVGVSINEIDI